MIQPGSTVATSLVEGEAKPKHVALLSIKDDNWKMESIPLTTVRPFLLREVVLAEYAEEYELHDERTLMDMLAKQASRGPGAQRPRGREAERPRGREAERPRGREAERPRGRGAEGPRGREAGRRACPPRLRRVYTSSSSLLALLRLTRCWQR